MQIEVHIALNFFIAYLYDKLPRRRVNLLGEQMLEYIRMKFQDHWYPESPAKGSAYRSIRISKDKVDKILINAAIDVGLDLQEILNTLPNDLTIWIDPGEVSYRIGEKSPVEILYKEQTHNEEIYSWINPLSTPVISVQSFAQTKFGSLKRRQLF